MRKKRDPFPIPEELQAEFEHAVKLRRERAFEEARALLGSLLERAPHHPRIITEVGNNYYREGDYVSAEEAFRRALEVEGYGEAAAACMCMLYARTGRHDEAAEFAARILAATPEMPLTWYTLGAVYARQRLWHRALEYSLIAVAMDDGFTDAHYNCACAYAQLGNITEGIRHLARGLGSTHLVILAAQDGDLNPLRAHPEFENILIRARARLGIASPS